MEENRKYEKTKILPKRKNDVFVRFFLKKKLRRRTIKHNLFLQHFGKKWRLEICFVFEKSSKMRIQRRGFHSREHKQRVLYNKKKMLCSHFSKVFSTLWNIDIGKWHEETLFRNDVTKKKESKGEKKVVEMRRHWSGSAPKSQFTQHNSH